MKIIKKISIILFWIIVVIGGVYLLDKLLIGYEDNKQNILEEKINTACEVILDQQPTNRILYDRCREKGYDEFK
jgi:hypothetical protein